MVVNQRRAKFVRPSEYEVVYERVEIRFMSDAQINRDGPKAWDIDMILALSVQREKDTEAGVPTDIAAFLERYYPKWSP